MSDELGDPNHGTTGGSPWNHHICEHCWGKKQPGRWPVRMSDDVEFQDGINMRDVAFFCCYCGCFTYSHIMVRDEPGRAHCRHDAFATRGQEGDDGR